MTRPIGIHEGDGVAGIEVEYPKGEMSDNSSLMCEPDNTLSTMSDEPALAHRDRRKRNAQRESNKRDDGRFSCCCISFMSLKHKKKGNGSSSSICGEKSRGFLYWCITLLAL